MAADWYYQADGQTRGPIDAEQLKQLAHSGRIDPDTLVARGRNGAWLPAREAPGLFDGIAAPASVAPRPSVAAFDDETDEDFRVRPRGSCGRTAVTALGVVTVILASLLTLGGCTTAVLAVFCYTASTALQEEGQKAVNQANGGPNAPGAPVATPVAGCIGVGQQLVGLMLFVVAVILTVLAVVHLLLALGHFFAGFGVLRRRPWARILALVVSVLTGLYGLLALYQIGSRVVQGPAPSNGEAGGLAAAALVGVLFVAHAVFAWVVLLHPACMGQFRHSHSAGEEEVVP
jgi:hypothetical protein